MLAYRGINVYEINVIFWTKDSTMQFLCPKINKNLKEKKRKECVLFY
jgi:hypothetical protein